MNRDINWYMNTARKNKNISSDRNLARELKVSSVAGWRDPYRPRIPEHAVMVRLASMAQVPDYIAMIDRDIWEATYKAPETVPIYKKILKKFPQYAAAVLIAFIVSLATVTFDGGNSAYAGEKKQSASDGPIYIMVNFKRFYSAICSIFNRIFTPHFYLA